MGTIRYVIGFVLFWLLKYICSQYFVWDFVGLMEAGVQFLWMVWSIIKSSCEENYYWVDEEPRRVQEYWEWTQDKAYLVEKERKIVGQWDYCVLGFYIVRGCVGC